MTIHFVEGSLFEATADVLTNTVNCVGVMGKGIALEFKTQYPSMFQDYKRRCEKREVLPGEPYLWEGEGVRILNFPTKLHWRNPSKLSWIDLGLANLVRRHRAWGIKSIAIPALGCTCGGLKYGAVRERLEWYLAKLDTLDAYCYLPQQ
jgi:O-acetyl-ADP-ribose deacetylase (regulator of RNase III)